MTYATVRASTAPELAYLRTAGQYSRLYLAMFKPATVAAGRLAATIVSNDRVASVVINVTSGVAADIKKDMTLYAGTTAGASDLGIARVRKPIAGTILAIAEESDINWATVVSGGIYLTVVNDFDLWARHINTVSDTDFRMDYDITYTNQNSVFDPVPVLGGHRVVKLTGATVGTLWDFSNSWVIGSTISSYTTSCPTASSVTGGLTATPTITFNTAGWHPVYLTVAAANGKTYTGVRYVYVYSTASMPATVFQLGDCSIDYETGGWSVDVTVQGGVALADVPDRALCILFAEDVYGDTSISIGQLAGCENIICIGRVSEERVNINAEQSEVTFTIQGSHYWFGKINAFPTGVIATDHTPANWAEMNSPTVQKVLYRLLHWGCTATTIMDVYISTDTRLATELTSPSGNLWGQITEIANTTIHATTGIDRFGRLFVEREPQIVPLAERTWATVMTLTKVDWYDEVNMERIIVTPTGRIDLSGIVASSADDGDALFSLSPGHVFKHYGSPEVIDRLLLSTQVLSNQLAGLFLGWRNNPYPNTEFKLSANNRMIDCFPRQYIAWSVAAGDSPRAFTLSGNFIPRRVSFRWDADTGFMETEVSLELASVEQISTNGDIPGETGNISLPPAPPPIPPPPIPPIIIPGEIPSTATMKAILHCTNYGLLYTENFNEDAGADVRWRIINAGLSALQYQAINFIVRVPTGGIYVGKRNRTGFGVDPFLAYAPAPGQMFTLLETDATIKAKIVGAATNSGVNAIGFNPLTGQVAYLISTEAGHKFMLGYGTTFTAGAEVAMTIGVGAVGSISFGNNQWRLSTHTGSVSRFYRIAANGGSVPYSKDMGAYAQQHIGISTTNSMFYFPFAFTSNILHHFTDVGLDTPVGDTLVSTNWDYQIDCDPTGMFVMTVWDTGARGKSSDGAYTFTGIPALPYEGAYSFDYIGGAGLSSHWAACASRVYYSKDFGSFFSDQTGDLRQVAPTGSLTQIKAWW